MINISSLKALSQYSGKFIAVRQAVVIKPDVLKAFLTLCGDQNPIHTNHVSADEGGTAIIPGNLLLSKLPQIVQSSLHFPSGAMLYTIKYDNVLFKSPITLDDELCVSIKIQSTRYIKDKIFVTYHFAFFANNSENPSARGQFSDAYLEPLGEMPLDL